MHLKKWIFMVFVLFVLAINLSLSQSPVYSDQDCLSCHGKSNISQITSSGKLRSLFVDTEEWSQDVHHQGNITCVDCHTHATPYLHFREGFIDVDCAGCHPEEAEENQKNIHQTFTVVTGGKELPGCHHCHTKHHVLLHDNPSSSVNEANIGATCGKCHAEVMISGILKGASLGKISGHRKGDFSERFDMKACINCHYEDSAHGSKRVYKDFCSRCHDYRSKTSTLFGSIHLDSKRMLLLNYLGSGLVIIFLFGAGIVKGFTSRKKIVIRMKKWHDQMKIERKETSEQEQDISNRNTVNG